MLSRLSVERPCSYWREAAINMVAVITLFQHAISRAISLKDGPENHGVVNTQNHSKQGQGKVATTQVGYKVAEHYISYIRERSLRQGDKALIEQEMSFWQALPGAP